MKPAPFEYHSPTDVDEAVQLLDALDDSKVLAGGQSLIPMLNMRLAQPAALVSLDGVQGLELVRRDDGHLSIGAMVRQRALELDEVVARDIPILREVVRYVGHVTIRNRGTVGGSLAHADPAAELPVAMVALDAELTIAAPGSTRTVRAADFFESYLTTVLADNEILTEIRVPVPPASAGFAFDELARRHGDFAMASVLAMVELDGGGGIASARIAVGGAHPVPLRPLDVEAGLAGATPSPAAIDAAADAVARAVQPLWDVHASVDHRRDLTRLLTRRTLSTAIARARGDAG
jgi:aerobic carbon-monoxide dehydrogenase medium subunit